MNFWISLCTTTVVKIDIYIEAKMVCPLADILVARIADIGHLVLEDVISTRSISILIEHHSSSCATC